jgi:hypothetical protein
MLARSVSCLFSPKRFKSEMSSFGSLLMKNMLLLTTIFCALALQPADAAQVFKCTVEGKTVYQDAPCGGKGESLDIDADVTHEQHQEAIQQASKERQQSTATKPSSHKPSHSTHTTTKEAVDPDAEATQKAIAECESQRGVDCKSPETTVEHKWKNTPMTPQQQQAAARAREERRKEDELRRWSTP